MKSPELAFLVGSGISKESHAPMVWDLTERVLEGAWKDETDWRFYPQMEGETPNSTGVAAQAQALIRIVHDEIKDHLRSREGRNPNYEDYFAALKQIQQDSTGEIVNPLISGTVENIRRTSAYLHENFEGHIDPGPCSNRFASLAERATNLIQSVVSYELGKCGAPEKMDLLAEAAQRLPGVCVFSLNHDLLIEKLLSEKGISFADGFSERNGDAIFFNWSWNEALGKLRLYKLHGSIDWYLVRYGDPAIDRFAKLSGDVFHAKLDSGKWLNQLDVEPNFLTGTTVKEQAYGHGLYGELFEEFRHRLNETRILVCSGYGWSDKGINIRVNQWMRDRPENKIILLYEDSAEAMQRIPFWRHKWDMYVNGRKLVHIRKWLSHCSLDEVMSSK